MLFLISTSVFHALQNHACDPDRKSHRTKAQTKETLSFQPGDGWKDGACDLSKWPELLSKKKAG
jgi:hypothetical protein